MTPLKLLAGLERDLRKYAGSYAVAGALAASFYRAKPRMTNDVDIALDLGSNERTKRAATRLLKTRGFKTSLGWIAGGERRLRSPIALVIGHAKGGEYGPTIDFLLPWFPWLKPAVRRAQENIIDFRFAKLPTLRPEDLIIAKAFALTLEPNRFQDLDDIQSIFAAKQKLNINLLVEELERLEVGLPRELHNILPSPLKRISKRYRSGTKRRN